MNAGLQYDPDLAAALRDARAKIAQQREELRLAYQDQAIATDGKNALRAETQRLRTIVTAPLAPDEMRLVDKHCDWIAFQHAWNAVMKRRRSVVDDEQNVGETPNG